MLSNTFVVTVVLFCLTAACRAVDIDERGSNPDDWLSSLKSPFKTFFDIESRRSRHNGHFCLPKDFQIVEYEHSVSGDSSAMYIDGSRTRKAMHVSSNDLWYVEFYYPGGTEDVYRYNGSECRCWKFNDTYKDMCFDSPELTLNKTFTIGLDPVIKVNLWLYKPAPTRFFFFF